MRKKFRVYEPEFESESDFETKSEKKVREEKIRRKQENERFLNMQHTELMRKMTHLTNSARILEK